MSFVKPWALNKKVQLTGTKAKEFDQYKYSCAAWQKESDTQMDLNGSAITSNDHR